MTPILLVLLGTAAFAAADTTRFVVVNHGRVAGDMVVVSDGVHADVRYSHTDRNRGTRVATTYRLSPTGVPLFAESRPLSADGSAGDVSDSFRLDADSARWVRGRTAGAAPADSSAFYRTGNTPFDRALLARYALRRPGQGVRLLPAGTARAQVVVDTVLGPAGRPLRVRFVEVSTAPGGSGFVWLDQHDELVASGVGWFITVRPDAVELLPALRDIELAHLAARAGSVARQLARPANAVTAITNGDVFDVERGVLLPRYTVIVRGDRIAEVGPAAAVGVPAGAAVIDATGHTVLPGLWDMHGHLQHSSQSAASLLQLAFGITTVRDLAADTDVAVSHRDRADSGEILSPRILLGGFIEGPGEWAGPSDALARTEDEARALVARYDSLGYRQVKLYNLVHPDLVPTIARETKTRGMRLSGHVPRGMSVAAAVQLGFDEINHAAFLFSTFFPDSLYLPTMRAYSAVAAAVAPTFDVDGPEMTGLIELLRQSGTVIDGTFNLWMGGRAPLTAPMDAAAQRYARLIRRLYDAGVTIVPGTDNVTSSSYVTELELYQLAGIPAIEVLKLATIGAARVMGDDADYGSISPGKVADIIVVGGRPTERVADLARVAHVLRAGRAYTPAELRAAAARQP